MEAYYQIAVEKGCNSNFLEDLKLAIEDFKAFQCEEPEKLNTRLNHGRSKELTKLYGFMQAFIYITVCIEILLFVHFPFSEQIMPLLSKMAKIPIYSNILYSKLFTFFIIMVTCIGTRSKKDLELDPTKQIIFPLIFGFIMFFGSICFLFF